MSIFKLSVRILVVLAVVAAVQLALGQAQPGSTPYLPAFSDLTGSDAYAAGGCSFRTCLFRGERQYCENTTLMERCAQKGTNCTHTSC